MTTPSRLFRSTAQKAAPKPKIFFRPILSIPLPVSSALSTFLGGVPQASRFEAVKKIWDHIKLNKLQNPANKREINCDDKLKTIFDGKDKVGFTDITKLLSPHFLKANKD